MWKQRIIAIVILLVAGFAGFWVYHSETTNKKPFQLGLDLSGGTYLTYRADTDNLAQNQVQDSLKILREVIEKRVNSLGISEAVVTNETVTLPGSRENRLVISLPGVTDVKQALDLIGKTPLLEFKTEDEKSVSQMVVTSDMVQDGTISLSGDDISLDKKYTSTELTGQYLKRSVLQFDQATGQPIIGLEFNTEGAKLFESITRDNIGKTVAIYLDGEMISNPVVNEAITGGQAVINGSFTPVEARDLVARLNSGALPVPVHLISTESIGPTLGANALQAGVMAGIVGFILILVLMVFWYRLLGIIAAVSLIIYAIIMFLLFKYIPVTLSTAGIAGFIISLGMAVDANVLIFERIREELKSGKSLQLAIDEGFARAWLSIRDGNLSSIISAVVLFWFGTVLIKGFAITFGLGVLISMITAITLSRILLKSVAGNNQGRIKRFLFSSGFSK